MYIVAYSSQSPILTSSSSVCKHSFHHSIVIILVKQCGKGCRVDKCGILAGVDKCGILAGVDKCGILAGIEKCGILTVVDKCGILAGVTYIEDRYVY